MSQDSSSERQSFYSQISEDWWAVILGIALILLVCSGVLGIVPW